MDKQQLSALLDGELDELATVRLLRALDEDPEALGAWEEYGLIGDALREREGPGQAGCAGARRALAQIQAEPVPLPQRRPVAWRPALPWALAASAALMAFLLGGPMQGLSVAGGGGAWQQRMAAWFGGQGSSQPPETVAGGGGDPMARYIDYHREVAAPGFERTAFVGADEGSGRGR